MPAGGDCPGYVIRGAWARRTRLTHLLNTPRADIANVPRPQRIATRANPYSRRWLAMVQWRMTSHPKIPCLSIRQPWAWMILRGGKDIENRNWPTRVRGRVLIHASKAMTRGEWGDAWMFAHGSSALQMADAAGLAFDNIQRGGIVGSVEIADCVDGSDSRWFVGRYGFVLRDPRPIPFVPYRGALGFFNVPRTVLPAYSGQTPIADAPAAGTMAP